MGTKASVSGLSCDSCALPMSRPIFPCGTSKDSSTSSMPVHSKHQPQPSAETTRCALLTSWSARCACAASKEPLVKLAAHPLCRPTKLIQEIQDNPGSIHISSMHSTTGPWACQQLNHVRGLQIAKNERMRQTSKLCELVPPSIFFACRTSFASPKESGRLQDDCTDHLRVER